MTGWVRRIQYRSLMDAMNRLAVVYLKSCHPSGKHTVELLAPTRVRRHLFAMNIQCVFRGFISRRWYRSYKAHVEMRLCTSFSRVRKENATASESRPDYLFDQRVFVSPQHSVSRQTSFRSVGSSGGGCGRDQDSIVGWQESFYSMASTALENEGQDDLYGGNHGTDMLMRLQAESLSVAGLQNMAQREPADARVVGRLTRVEKEMRSREAEKKKMKDLAAKKQLSMEVKTRETLLASLRKASQESSARGFPLRVIEGQVARVRKARKEEEFRELKRLNTAQRTAHEEAMGQVKEFGEEVGTCPFLQGLNIS